MTLLVGALTLGLILALVALGVYVSYRIFNIPDMTAEGTITLGNAFFSGIGTLLFVVVNDFRVPSYFGSSSPSLAPILHLAQ